MAELAATTQVGVLYLQSTLLLRKKIMVRATGALDGESSDGPRTGLPGRDFPISRKQVRSEHQSLVFANDGGSYSETPSYLDKEPTGFAPAALLDFLWWMERRLSIAHSMPLDRRGRPLPALSYLRLLRPLRSVLKHPLVKLALRRTIFAPGARMPPLERLIALEVAISSEKDFCGAYTKLTFLESIILGRLEVEPAKATENTRSRIIDMEEKEGASGDEKRSPQRSEGHVGAKYFAEKVQDVWEECVACLLGNPILRDAAYLRVCRDGPSKEADGCSLWGDCFIEAKFEGCLVKAEKVQALLDSMLKVMKKLCHLEATAYLLCQKVRPDARIDERRSSHDERQSSGRRSSLLLAEALVLLNKQPCATTDVGKTSALILIAEITIPAISASEGRKEAFKSFCLLWKEWLCKVPSLDDGAIVSLTKTALLWCADQSYSGNLGGQLETCPVLDMLESLPCLAVDMVRVWPRLARTLRPAIGPSAHGGWVRYLSTLYSFGGELIKDLSNDRLEPSKHVRGVSSSECSKPPPVQRTTTDNIGSECVRPRKDGRVPLGTANKPSNRQKENRKPQGNDGDNSCQTQEPQDGLELMDMGRGKCAQNRVDGNTAPLAIASLATIFKAKPGQNRFCGVPAALPSTCAELVVSILNATAAVLANVHKKRPRQMPVSLVGTKRAKRSSIAISALILGTPMGLGVKEHDEDLLFEGTNTLGTGGDAISSKSLTTAFQPPHSTAWVDRVLEPLYGSCSEAGTSPSIRVLLETLIKVLGDRKSFKMRGANDRLNHSTDIRAAAQSLELSLAAAILGYAPTLIAHLMEPPCLSSTASSAAPTERLGRSLAVLDALKLLFEKSPPQNTKEQAIWLRALLLHYSAALLSMICIQKDSAEEIAEPASLGGSGWADVVAFVHGRLRNVSPRELRLIPVAMAVQEVDPLMKQYF